MANNMRGEATIEFGGKTRTLVFTNNSICELEEILDCPFHKAHEKGMRFLRAALHVGLFWQDRKLTLQRVGQLIDPDKVDYYIERLNLAITGAFGKGEEPKEDADEAGKDPQPESIG
jgi:hypothetical protein